jgi:hypothetical protein
MFILFFIKFENIFIYNTFLIISKVNIEMLVLATILFILLSPGLLLTIPPVDDWTMNGIIMSGKTNHLAIFVHGALYFILLKLIATNTFGLAILQEWEEEITGSGHLTL